MPRRNEREEVIAAITAYMTLAEGGDDRSHPLDVVAVARAVGKGRTTLYKYGVPALLATARERRRRAGGLRPRERERLAYEQLAVDQALELQALAVRNAGLVGRLALVEANAIRLGIDAEELYRPMVKPDRRVSHAGRGRRHLRD